MTWNEYDMFVRNHDLWIRMSWTFSHELLVTNKLFHEQIQGIRCNDKKKGRIWFLVQTEVGRKSVSEIFFVGIIKKCVITTNTINVSCMERHLWKNYVRKKIDVMNHHQNVNDYHPSFYIIWWISTHDFSMIITYWKLMDTVSWLEKNTIIDKWSQIHSNFHDSFTKISSTTYVYHGIAVRLN